MLNYDHRSGIECVKKMFEVSFSLVHARLQTLVEILNSVCHWLPRKFVPYLLQRGSKFGNRWWLFL